MNLEIIIDKNTCFYYWVQLISNWDPYPIDPKSYNYYLYKIKLSKVQNIAINKIKDILQNDEKSRLTLAQLYLNKIENDEAKEIAKQSEILKEVFESVWQESLPNLEKWRESLKSVDFNRFYESMGKIINFLDSDFDLKELYTLYLIQNAPLAGVIGHAINGTNFILVRPPSNQQVGLNNNIISIITHEYIHLIEHKSKISRTILKNSYDKYITTNNISSPKGYTWRSMYVESLVYCFADNVIGGYLRPETYNKPRPTINEMKDSIWKVLDKNKHNTRYVISWAALNILPDVEEYIEKGLKIDQKIADKLSKIFLEFYFTQMNK